MSANFCLNAVATSLQLGKNGAGLKSLSSTATATRNSTDTGLVTMEVLTPVADDQAATKKYVDDLVALNVTWKEAAVVAASTDITISSPGAAIDGVPLSNGDRVVLRGQTAPVEDGIYIWDTAVTPMVRSADWAAASLQSGSVVSIQEGTDSDNIYIASADPLVVGVNAPLFLLIGTGGGGVTSVTDQVAVPVGGASFLASGGSGAVTMNVLDDSARISVALALNVITLDIVALSIGAAQITNQGVTAAKLAVNASLIRATFLVSFTDVGSTVIGPSLLANSRVVMSSVDTTVDFDDPTVTIDVQVDAVSVQGATLNDPAIVDVYECTGLNQETVAAASVTAVVSAGTPTQGTARISVYYFVIA